MTIMKNNNEKKINDNNNQIMKKMTKCQWNEMKKMKIIENERKWRKWK